MRVSLESTIVLTIIGPVKVLQETSTETRCRCRQHEECFRPSTASLPRNPRDAIVDEVITVRECGVNLHWCTITGWLQQSVDVVPERTRDVQGSLAHTASSASGA